MKSLYITIIFGLLLSIAYTQETPINKGLSTDSVNQKDTSNISIVKPIKRKPEEIERLTIKRQRRKERLELMDKVDPIVSDSTKLK